MNGSLLFTKVFLKNGVRNVHALYMKLFEFFFLSLTYLIFKFNLLQDVINRLARER